MSAYAQPAALLTCAVVTTADFTVGKGATFKTDSVTKPSASAFFYSSISHLMGPFSFSFPVFSILTLNWPRCSNSFVVVCSGNFLKSLLCR
jgi:hypothetical protein